MPMVTSGSPRQGRRVERSADAMPVVECRVREANDRTGPACEAGTRYSIQDQIGPLRKGLIVLSSDPPQNLPERANGRFSIA